MSAEDELDSFVTKLKCLWKSGRNAKLTVTTKYGKAWANLNVGLGRLQEHHQPNQDQGQGGNSRHRRLERRAKERLEAPAEATNDDVKDSKEAESGKAEEAPSVDAATAGEAVRSRVVIELDKEENQPLENEKCLHSPILQLDGAVGNLEQQVDHGDEEVYSFVSDYGEEDILWTLEELFSSSGSTLLSRVRVRPLKAAHLCTVSVKVTAAQTFAWPEMRNDQKEVFKDLKRILK